MAALLKRFVCVKVHVVHDLYNQHVFSFRFCCGSKLLLCKSAIQRHVLTRHVNSLCGVWLLFH